MLALVLRYLILPFSVPSIVDRKTLLDLFSVAKVSGVENIVARLSSHSTRKQLSELGLVLFFIKLIKGALSVS